MAWPDMGSVIYQKLITDATVGAATKVAGTLYRIYAGQAKEDADMPYIVFMEIAERDTRASPRDEVDALYQIDVWDTTRKDAFALFSNVHTALDGQTLTIGGWTNYHTAFEGKQLFVENVAGAQFFRYMGEYRIKASKD